MLVLYLIFFIFAILVSGCSSEETVNTHSSKAVNQNNKSIAQPPTSNSTPTKPTQLIKPQNNTKLSDISQRKPERRDLYNTDQTSTFYEDFDPEDDDDREQINYLEQLKNSTDPELRVEAINALDDIEAGRLLQYLRAALDDVEQSVRIAALKKLSEIELYGAVENILYALDDPDPDVVMAAIDAVEETADESLIPKLMPLLQHSNNKIRKRTEEVIEFMM